MPKVATRSDWIRLLVKAVRDQKFRSSFVESPDEAAARLKIHKLGANTRRLKELKASVKRFGVNKSVKGSDAKFWAVGVLQHIQVPRPSRPK